ncbi:MAG: sensor histidine kinase [Acidimicrobiia bacterium]
MRQSTPIPLVGSHRYDRVPAAARRAVARERRRIMSTLHDDVGQHLYRVLHGLEGASSRLDDGEVRAELDRLGEVVRHIDTVLRGELTALRIEERASDLRFELETLADSTRSETGIDVRVACDVVDGDLSEEVIDTLVATAREAIVNARKHANPRRIDLVAWIEGGAVHIEVENDTSGRPTRHQVPSSGMGLGLARRRLSELGGTLRFAQLDRLGARVVATIPVSGS